MNELDEIPDLKSRKYSAIISVAVTQETKTQLEFLKREKRKDTSTLLRTLIENFLQNLDLEAS